MRQAESQYYRERIADVLEKHYEEIEFEGPLHELGAVEVRLQ